ncbi:hypothetical protein [Kushneria indalinina]|uniref:hypothetical protein n=1 Tax=Kushneria indalinina TaxID=184067 RepID=UPI0011C058B3|nr:hypothetical protein [Kushneria indalinina]
MSHSSRPDSGYRHRKRRNAVARAIAGGQTNPLVYEANGREYLMIVATGHHFMETPSGDYVLTYALPE